MVRIGSGEVELLDGLGGAGGRPSGQAAVGLPVVVAVRGCGGSPVQGGDVGAVACDAAGALDWGGQPRTLPAGPAQPRTGGRRRMLARGGPGGDLARDR